MPVPPGYLRHPPNFITEHEIGRHMVFSTLVVLFHPRFY